MLKTTKRHRGVCASAARYRGRGPWAMCALTMLKTTKWQRGVCASCAHCRGCGPWTMCALIMIKTTKCHRWVCASAAHYRGRGPWAMCALMMLETTKCHRVVWGAHRVRATDGVVHGACVLSYCSRPLNATVGVCASLAHYRGRCLWAMCALRMLKTTKCHRGRAHRVRVTEGVFHGPCVRSS